MSLDPNKGEMLYVYALKSTCVEALLAPLIVPVVQL